GRDRFRGRIWRIAYTGKDAQLLAPIIDTTKASTKQLADSLADDNLTVRLTATHELVDRGGADVLDAVRNIIKNPKTAYQKAHALWVLARLDALDDATLDACAYDVVPAVRVH